MPTLINPIEVWDQMTPEQQRKFGLAGILHILGWSGARIPEVEPQQAYIIAGTEGTTLMARVLEPMVSGLKTNPPLPDLKALWIRTCRVCGCTDRYGCESGCHWVEEDVCSACVGAAQQREG